MLCPPQNNSLDLLLPPPLESDTNIFYFFDTLPIFEHFLKKFFLLLEKLITLIEKFSKFAKNELNAVNVHQTVMGTPGGLRDPWVTIVDRGLLNIKEIFDT